MTSTLRAVATMFLTPILLALPACGGGETNTTEEPVEVATPAPPGETDTLMLAQAWFLTEPDPAGGKARSVPGPAKLTLVRGAGDHWEVETIEDPDSNVFHKALVADLDGKGPAIVTIGANGARLKSWRKQDGSWQAVTHWAPTFGGKQERLRDLEIGDVTGDGRDDVLIATHDKGVVAVAEIPADGGEWTIHEFQKTEERIFVHEAEIGDVDGDGQNEFFVTPSTPNVLDGTPQPGWLVGYKWKDGEAQRTEVASFLGAHVKEILVADLEGRGRADLYAAIEPERKKTEAGVTTDDPLILRRYRFEGDDIQETDIATFRDAQCRFLTYGDLTGDGKLELVASTMTTGVWMLRQSEAGWMSELIAKDADFPEFEHAAVIGDLDHDGKLELFVVTDGLPDQEGKLTRYRWNGSSFDADEITTFPTDHMTFNVTVGKL